MQVCSLARKLCATEFILNCIIFPCYAAYAKLLLITLKAPSPVANWYRNKQCIPHPPPRLFNTISVQQAGLGSRQYIIMY